MQFYRESVNDCFRHLESSKNGLTKDQVKKSRERYGLNQLEEEKEKTYFQLFFLNFKSSLIYLLLFAACLSFFMGKILDGFVILVIVTLNAIIGTYLEGKSKKALKDLKKLATEKVLVFRDGKELKIASYDLVPGDIVFLREGDKVPADLRIVEAFSLFVDESTFTGESFPREKNNLQIKDETEILERDNTLYMGTTITAGHAKALATAIGNDTELGKISDLYKESLGKKTPLEKKLHSITKMIGVSVILITSIIFLLGIYTGQKAPDMLQISISLAVSAIPEGLPVAIAVILAMGVFRMSKRKAVVRKMSAVETLGRVNIICSDKTGTLTYNQLQVSRVFLADEVLIEGEGYETEGRFIFKDEKDMDRMPMLLTTAILCNSSELTKEGKKWHVKGDPLEAALLSLSKKYGLDENTVRKENPKIDEISFNSEEKYMATLNAVGDLKLIYLKGAPEVILENSSYFYNGKGVKIALGRKEKDEYLDKVSEMSKDGFKVLALAFRDYKGKNDKISKDDIEELVFLGLVGFIDSYRTEAVEAIKKAQEAGIKVIMITGDHLETASKIARDLGILKEGGRAILAKDADKFKDQDNVTVYARVTPEQKFKIVERLKSEGNIIAMTGDGVNDVPGLSVADVGVAMGFSGTPAARDAADLVLLDDNFITIVAAIDEGRTIFSNIRKVLFYLFSTSLGEVFTILFALLFSIAIPISAIQILWINLVTDGFFTIPLGLLKSEEDNLKKPPRKKEEGLLSRRIKFRVFAVAFLVAIGTLFSYQTSLYGGLAYAQTMAFMTLVVFQWFNAFNARSDDKSFLKNIHKDLYLFYALIGAALVQFIVLYTSFGNKVLGTVPLTSSDWLKILSICSTVILYVEGEKFMNQKSIKNHLGLKKNRDSI